MVIKTEQCSFSEFKIYPGHGSRFIARDGRNFIYLNRKCAVFSRRKVKSQKITWTIARRRLNKKIKQDEVDKKKRKRQVKIQRAIEGIALEDIQKKRSAKPQTRQAEKEQALREIKERKQKQIEVELAKRKDQKIQPVKAKVQPKKQEKKDKPKGAKKR